MNESQSGFSKPNLSTFSFFLSIHFLVTFFKTMLLQTGVAKYLFCSLFNFI